MATTTQTQPQSPPIGWKQITIDLAIDGASEAINHAGNNAEKVVLDSIKSASSTVTEHGKWGQTELTHI